MIRSTWYGRALCVLGFHRYAWRTRSTMEDLDPLSGGPTLVVHDQCRCRRIGCSLSRRWVTVNRESRRSW